MEIDMRKVRQVDVSYSNDRYMSVFLGVCKTQRLLEKYMDKNYDLLYDDYIGFELGIDFGINTYDEDFSVMVVNDKSSNSIDEVFREADVFDLSILKEQYPNGLDQPYNAVVVIGRMKYEGDVKEVHNKKFGYFKFLGIFEE